MLIRIAGGNKRLHFPRVRWYLQCKFY